MSRAAKVIRMGFLPGLVAVSIAFGTSQALAAPQNAPASRACVDESCDGACVARGYSFGVCNPGCSCYG